MSEKGYAKALATKKPSIRQRILSFFKEASSYKNEGLSKAAKKYYKHYQKMYAEFSALNKGANAYEGKPSPHEVLSLKDYGFDDAVKFFENAETVRRNEILQQFANGEIVYNKNKEEPAHFILRLKSLNKLVPNHDLAGSSNTIVPQSPEKSTPSAKKLRTSFPRVQGRPSPSA